MSTNTFKEQFLLNFINKKVISDPHKIVIIDSENKESISYLQLKNQIDRIAQNLQEWGYCSTDRIATLLPEGAEMAILSLAIPSFAIHTPLNPTCQEEELISYLSTLKAKALIVESHNYSSIVELAEKKGINIILLESQLDNSTELFSLRINAIKASSRKENYSKNNSDIALILSTSGTTSRPKIVPLTHHNLYTATSNICHALQLTEGDRNLAVMPFFHIHGLSTLFVTIATGGSIICLKEFSGESFFDCLEKFEPTWYSASPTIHQIILDDADNYTEIISKSKLRFIRSASAPMKLNTIKALENTFNVPFLEAYGMTEASPQIASNRLNYRKLGSVGQPINVEVAIISEQGKFLDRGEIGEIVVRGANVIKSYEEDENTLTNQESFINNWLKTGDNGYLDHEGYLFITGRCQDIINRGGEKISPQEVEKVLLTHPAIAEAICCGIPHPVLGKNVGALITLKSEFKVPSANDLFQKQLIQVIREFTAQNLSYFKVPQEIVIVPEIPKNLSGKIDRKELAKLINDSVNIPANDQENKDNSLSDIDKTLINIWQEVLQKNKININDNFFHLGGHSLKAIQVINRISQIFKVEIEISDIFKQPTISSLSKIIQQQIATKINKNNFDLLEKQKSDIFSIKNKKFYKYYPLSFVQKRLWFLAQMEPSNSNTYNMSIPLWLSGSLDIRILEDSLNIIIARHQSLRTNFIAIEGEPYQVIKPANKICLPVIDLTGLPFEKREIEALRLTLEEAEKPLNLSEDNLVRVKLISLEKEENVLVITLHHIIADGWSTRILHREIGLLYHAIDHGNPINLPDLPIQYVDYTLWQEKWLQGNRLTQQLNYWCQKLAQAPTIHQLPLDKPRPAVPSHQGARIETTIPEDITERLRYLAKEEGATLFMVLFAAFNTLLARYSREDDILVGIPIANRYPLETENLIGCFANTLVLRTDLSGNPSFRSLLKQVKATAQEAYNHQDIPFERIVEELHPERDLSRMPLVQIMFAFQNLPTEETQTELGEASLDGVPFQLTENLIARPFKGDRTTSKFDLTLYLAERNQGLIGAWQYNSDIFESQTITRLGANFQTLLQGICLKPDLSISQLPLINDQEYHLIKQQWLARDTFYHTHLCFHHLFEQQVEKTPDTIAVQCGEEKLTYLELNQQANQLAHYLQQQGLKTGNLVAILLPRSLQTIITILAILKAGGAYLPLDLEYPDQRLVFMLESAQVSFLIANARAVAKLNYFAQLNNLEKILDIDCNSIEIEQQSKANFTTNITANDLAYVIYTSGTTGTPKGVMISHGNLSHYVQGMENRLGIAKEDIYLHTASFAFSSSVRQLTIPLSCGATVYLAKSEEIKDPPILFNIIEQHQISVIDFVPSYQRIFLQFLQAKSNLSHNLTGNHLKVILSASEPLSPDLPQRWLTFFPQAQFINMFGQTETCGIVSTYHVSPSQLNPDKLVPIGKALPNTHIYILDSHLQLVPLGVVGEIYISSPSVSKGYLHQPELMEKQTLTSHFGDYPDRKLYRTGDFGRYLNDGNIEFISRGDNQIKIRGFRIEPEEVEIAIRKHPSIQETVIATFRSPQPPLVRGDKGGITDQQNQRLVAFVVFKKSLSEVSIKDKIKNLRLFLRQKLPDYMIPSLFIKKENLPRTPNGKLDRQALINELSSPNPQIYNLEEKQNTEEWSAEKVIEQKLIKIWEEVLNVKNIAIDDNFFDLGGDSIVSTQIVLKANQAGVNLTLKQLFQYQTIGDLATICSGYNPSSESQNIAEKKQISGNSKIISEEETVLVSIEKLRNYGNEALLQAGLVPEGAKIVTEVQLESSLRGQLTHNMGDIPRYAKRLMKGILNPQPHIKVEQETDFSAKIDGDNAPGQWVATVAMNTAISKAKNTGIGIVGVRRSNHFGAAAQYVWMATQSELIGICTTNGPLILAPTGGVTPTFGNNPFAAGLPTSDKKFPIILDIAMSVAPRGKIGLQVAEGKPLAQGWIFDSLGRPTTNLADLAAGLGIPIGEHKGYGLAFIFEALAGVLTGAGFAWDHYKHGQESDKELDLGHLFIALNPELFTPLPLFYQRLDRLKQQTKQGKKAEGVTEIFVPGEIEMKAREVNLVKGIPLRLSIYQRLVSYGKKVGLKTLISGNALK